MIRDSNFVAEIKRYSLLLQLIKIQNTFYLFCIFKIMESKLQFT